MVSIFEAVMIDFIENNVITIYRDFLSQVKTKIYCALSVKKWYIMGMQRKYIARFSHSFY